MPEVTIHEMPQPLGLFAGELFDRGVEYLEAFQALTSGQELKHYHAESYLFSHSLELMMKSFLAAQGVSKGQIRGIGHKLGLIYDRCSANGLPLVPNLKAYARHYQEMNRDHDFRYPTGYNLTVPRPADSIIVARALQTAIAGFIEGRRTSAELAFASETRHLRGSKVRWSD